MEQITSSEKPSAQGKALLLEIAAEAEAWPSLDGDGGLTAEIADALTRRFEALSADGAGGHAARSGRGTLAYWRDHGRLTGVLMTRIAQRCGGDPELYRRVGELHDIDYLAYPHDARGASGLRHPGPLAAAMRSCGVHPVICCAILEHARSIAGEQAPSSRLSAALSAAEDLATLLSLKPTPPALGHLSADARELYHGLTAAVPFTGRARVSQNVDTFVNAPLALALGKGSFRHGK